MELIKKKKIWLFNKRKLMISAFSNSHLWNLPKGHFVCGPVSLITVLYFSGMYGQLGERWRCCRQFSCSHRWRLQDSSIGLWSKVCTLCTHKLSVVRPYSFIKWDVACDCVYTRTLLSFVPNSSSSTTLIPNSSTPPVYSVPRGYRRNGVWEWLKHTHTVIIMYVLTGTGYGYQ